MRTEQQIRADAKDESAFSNHTEYEIWAGRYCYECVNDDDATETWCPILGVSLLGRWPLEWTRARHDWQIGDKTGSYEVVDTCTEFEQRPDGDDPGDDPQPDPGPGPYDEEQPGQTDIFSFFAEDIVERVEQLAVTR